MTDRQPMGYAPLIEYCRVRTPAGIVSTDEHGDPRSGRSTWRTTQHDERAGLDASP